MYTLKYNSPYGTTELLRFFVNMYECDKSLAVQAFSQSEDCADYWEPYGTVTVCLYVGCGDNCAFVDTNNLPGIDTVLEKEGIAKKTGRVLQSGFCVYPEMKFNTNILKQMDSEGYARYREYRNNM